MLNICVSSNSVDVFNGIVLRIMCVAISRHQHHAHSNGNMLRIMCVALLLCVVEKVCVFNVVENGFFPMLKLAFVLNMCVVEHD